MHIIVQIRLCKIFEFSPVTVNWFIFFFITINLRELLTSGIFKISAIKRLMRKCQNSPLQIWNIFWWLGNVAQNLSNSPVKLYSTRRKKCLFLQTCARKKNKVENQSFDEPCRRTYPGQNWSSRFPFFLLNKLIFIFRWYYQSKFFVIICWKWIRYIINKRQYKLLLF